MKKSCRIIAMMLIVVIFTTSMMSCGIVNGQIGDNHTSSTPQSKPNHTHFYIDGKCECGKSDTNYKPNHNHSFVNGKCACGEIDPNYEPPHEHSYVDGKCECDAIDEEYISTHECESLCTVCGFCLDFNCEYNVCFEKCSGHQPTTSNPYSYFPVISEIMPVIHINTEDGNNNWATMYNRNDKLAGSIEYVNATVSVTDCEEEYIFSNVEASVKVRGNYTLEYEKKPLRIKFNSKQNMLGLHDGEKYKNWVLLADWKDLSMINNTVAFYLGNTILGSDGYYCTDFRNVEVYLNGQYWGVYLLVEQQEAKDGRSSVPEVEKNYTGNDIGYFFEYDGYYTDEKNITDGDPTFTMNHQGLPSGTNGYTVKSDIYADSQLFFLQSHMNNIMYIAYQATKGNYYMFDENYNVIPADSNSNTKDIISSVIDIQSLVDVYILNEIAKDLDVDWSSFYLSLNMTTEGNKKLTFEAPWDFDSSFGLVSRDNCASTTGLYAATNANPWFQLVVKQDWFWEMVYQKWAEMKDNGVLENALELIGLEKETYKDYYIKNYTRWSSRVLYGNNECVSQINSYKDINTAQGLAADYLANWISARLAWLDSQWSRPEELPEEEIPENTISYIYEAEDAELVGFVSNAIRYDRDYASANAYVGKVDYGTSISFTITAEENTIAYLYIGISKRSSSRYVSDMFSLSVNGNAILMDSKLLPAISPGEEDWHTFISLRIATIQLFKGENTIVFNTISSDATNFDFIEIYSTEKLK